jgi:hypothetical protein
LDLQVVTVQVLALLVLRWYELAVVVVVVTQLDQVELEAEEMVQLETLMALRELLTQEAVAVVQEIQVEPEATEGTVVLEW